MVFFTLILNIIKNFVNLMTIILALIYLFITICLHQMLVQCFVFAMCNCVDWTSVFCAARPAILQLIVSLRI